MPVISVSLDVPLEIYTGLLTGKLTRFGSVVRESGKIVKHLDEAFIPEQTVGALKDFANQNKILIGIGVVVAVTAIVGTITYYTVKSSKNKKSAEIQIPKCVAEFNSTFCTYLDAIQSGKLDMHIVNRLIADLDEINENYSIGNIKIDFSADRLTTLMNLLFNYTKKFAGANSIEFNELESSASASEDSTFSNLRHYLEVQKQIFEKTA